jgi:hypothetical protein
MKISKTPSSQRAVAAAIVSALVAGSAQAATILVDRTFDGVANDVGPAFQQISNGVGTGSATVGTGVVTLANVTSGSPSTSRGFNTSTTVDVTSVSGATGFKIEWVVTGGTTLVTHPTPTNGGTGNGITANGLFFGVTNSTSATGTGLFANTTEAIGVTIISPTHGNYSLYQTNGTDQDVTSLGISPTQASLEDGFTLALTVNNDNTYLVTSTGLSTNFNASGTLSATGTQYSEIASSLVANTSIQGDNVSYTVSRVTVTAIPEPSSALLGSLGLLALLRRRRN